MAEPEQDEGVTVAGRSDAVLGDGGEVGLVLDEHGRGQPLLQHPDQAAVPGGQAGGLLVVTSPNSALAMCGFGLLGLGVAVVVPLAFAAAGRSGPNPSRAIAGVATITYTSGLMAPSAIGSLAEATSLIVSFGLVTVLAFGLVLGAGVLRAGDRRVAAKGVGAPGTAAAEPRA